MINWKVRIKNKTFWITLIPAAIVLTQCILNLFGITIDLTKLQEQLLSLVNAAFILLSVLGIVTDPTTQGVSDSPQALKYDKPKED